MRKIIHYCNRRWLRAGNKRNKNRITIIKQASKYAI